MQDRHHVSGIREPLPDGEQSLWEGAPVAQGLARRVLHERWIAGYFGVLVAFALLQASTAPAGQTVARIVWIALLAAVVLGLVRGLAHLMARSTRYTVTNRCLVIQKGVVLPSVVNIPFERISGLALRDFGNGTGDLVLTLVPGARIGYLFLWPHARPWRLAQPEPMLRSVPDVGDVASTLRDAYLAHTASVVPAAQSEPTHYRMLDDDDVVVAHNGSVRRDRATAG